MEEDNELLRTKVKMLAGGVRELEQWRDYDKMKMLHTYDHLDESHSLVQYQ